MRDIKLGNALLRSAFFVEPKEILAQGDKKWLEMVNEASMLEQYRANLIASRISKLLLAVLTPNNGK